MAVQYSKSDINGFLPGKQLQIQGTMTDKGFFQVLLEDGGGSEMFHYSVNIDPPNVFYTGNDKIRNWSHCWHLGRHRNWDWNMDTIGTGNEIPIKKINQKFNMVLRSTNDGIEIIVDGKPVYTADGWSKEQLKNIKQLKIKGDIRVDGAQEQDGGGGGAGGKTIENPSVPAKLDFSRFGFERGLDDGMRIRIVGVPTAAKRFQIDLVEDPNHQPSDKLEDHSRHFHFNPRFGDKQVVRNSLIKGKGWQSPEEREGGFPFAVNKQFVVDIVGMPGNRLKVIVDNQPFCEFGPRGDLSTVDRLEIYGDVQVKSVTVADADGGMGEMMGWDSSMGQFGGMGGMGQFGGGMGQFGGGMGQFGGGMGQFMGEGNTLQYQSQ